jgi:60 kDa SS-A/Ro ribonucleoprotein
VKVKFNTTATTNNKVYRKGDTVNLAGGEAFSDDAKLELVSILLTSFVQDQFYRKAGDAKSPDKDSTLGRICTLIEQLPDKKFAGKAAIYARNEYGMRSISHVVAGELAKTVKGKEWVKDFFNRVVRRPDDMTEILAYYLNKYGKPVPNSLKKGFASAIGRFDPYQIAKWRVESAAVKLVDVVNIVHPKPTKKNGTAINELVADTLRSTETWEAKLSKSGQEAGSEEEKVEFKADAWADLINSKKLGYLAGIKNARNIIEQAPNIVDAFCEFLTDESLIEKSLVLPFRYVTALEEVEKLSGGNARKVIVALNKALDISCSNVPKFLGRTLVALDCSGSMDGKPAKIGSLFAAVLLKSNDADLILFSNDAKYKTINPLDSTTTIAKSIRFAPGGTNFRAIFQTANQPYDRIIILSDMQAWVDYNAPIDVFDQYKKKYNCKPHVYSFDLAGYGTLQFPQEQVYCLAGWSDKCLEVMGLLEKDRNALVHEIEKIEL